MLAASPEQGGGQEIKFDEDGNPILPDAPSGGKGGLGSKLKGVKARRPSFADGMGSLTGGVGKAMAKAEAAVKHVVPGVEEGVPPAEPEPEIEPEQAREIVRKSKWASKK